MIVNTVLKSLAAALTIAGSVCAVASEGIFEENFKSYPDFDPGLRNWQFRGIGGEIIGGAYQFTGVTQNSSEYLDIAPDYTMGLVRDFKAGSKLRINAVAKAAPHKFPVFDPGKNTDSRIGIVILNQPFLRRVAAPMDNPALTLTLNKSANGARTVSFDCTGKEKPRITGKTIVEPPAAGWLDNVDYSFEILLSGNLAQGIISDGSKVIFKRELESSDFARVFQKAYPGFANRRMTGQLSSFRADSLNSAQDTEVTTPLPIPRRWAVFTDVKDAAKFPSFKSIPDSVPGADKASAANIESGKVIDLGKLFGGHKPGRVAALFATLNVRESGAYIINCKADWFWRLDVNGSTVMNLMNEGNGSKKTHTVLVSLSTGENTIMILVGSGSAGWNLCLTEPTAVEINNALAKKYLYGSDTLYWNLDRLLDDITKLKRDNIVIDGLEQKIIGLRKALSPSLSSRETAEYDLFLDEAYAKVYDGYRVISLKAEIDGLKALAAALGSNANDGRIAELEKLSLKLRKEVKESSTDSVDKTALAAQKIIGDCKKSNQGYAEGVSKGGSFGRFGWMTSTAIGSYSSGDGLLANQILSNGALARQYISYGSKPEDCWVARFRFDGDKDSGKAAEVASLKTLGANVVLQFGYDPNQFYTGNTPDNVAVKEISWTHKKFSCADAFVADMSILSPSLLLESPFNQFSISDPAGGHFSRIGYLNSDGKAVSLPAGSDGVLYDQAANSRLGSNWILLWDDDNSFKDLTGHLGSVPVQIIFQRQPEKIVRSGSSVTVTLGRNGALWLNTPFGARLQPTGNWKGEMPPAAAASCTLFGRSALAYPQNCREFYRLSEDGSRIEILDSFSYKYFKDNDWGIEPLELAPLPPLLSLMTDRGFDAVLPQGLYELNYPSVYGPLRAVKGSKITYSLPVPQAPRIILPENTDAVKADKELLAKRTMANVEGMRFRLYDEKIVRSWHSLNFPILVAAKPWPYLDPVYRDYLKGLFSYNMAAGSGYRTNRVWRSLVEPYSGKKYYYSFSISIEDPGDVGVFGDRGYGVGNHLNQLDYAAALSGNYELLRKMWSDKAPLASPEASRDGKILTIDKMLGYVKDVHDWAWMDDGSNDAGDNGPVVDCSQSTFGGHGALLRMAKEVGSPDDVAKASYFLAKGQLSLTGRTAFTGYGHENGLLGVDSINVGFREFITPDSYANSPMLVKTVRQEYDGSYDSVLCYAFYDMYEIYYPYARYIWNDLRDYERIRQLYFPNSDTGKGTHAHLGTRLVFLLFNGMPVAKVRASLDSVNDEAVFWIRNMRYLETMPLLMTGGSPLVLCSWAPLAVPEFKFEPSTKTARIKLSSVPAGFRLEGLSSHKPQSVTVNGKAAEYIYDPETFKFSVKVPQAAAADIEAVYAEIDPSHFMPVPIPPVMKSTPVLRDELNTRKFERASDKKREPEVSALPVKNDTPIFIADFNGEPQKDPLLPAGGFYFGNWGKVKQQPGGGITGAYPPSGVPPLSMEVKASSDNFTGRGSPVIKIPKNCSSLIITGKILRSKDYKGNNPMIFLWVSDNAKKSSPVFFDIADAPAGEWQNFEFVQLYSGLIPNAETLVLNLTSRKENSATEVAGSVYYKNIKISVR
ncbi:MAG: hypothetical protein WCV67_07425 [Victivallaceae bacterium]|jgi:hypothetical protein